MDVTGFEDAGLYDPLAPTVPDRLAVLEFLVQRRATVEEMVEADADGRRSTDVPGRVWPSTTTRCSRPSPSTPPPSSSGMALPGDESTLAFTHPRPFVFETGGGSGQTATAGASSIWSVPTASPQT